MKNQKGFTLIELMIVVAIIAILAAIAIPQYQTYVVKSQVNRAMAEAGDLKVVVEDCLNNGKLAMAASNAAPTNVECASTATSSDLILAASTQGGVASVPVISDPLTTGATITVNFGNHASAALTGATLTWTRDVNGGWSCATTALNKYAPGSCPGA